jgi:hypothetical protein
MNKEKIPSISLFGLISVILFIVLSLTARALYPFGDEPDFSVRAPDLIFSEHSWWSPYYWLSDLLSQLDYTSNCIINSTPLSLTQEIDRTTCTQNTWQILLRLIITVTVAMPLLLAVTFRKNFVSLTQLLRYKISHAEWNERLNILSLTLVFPGFIYFFGALAEEQYVLILSILIFLLWGNIYVIILLFYLISLIDIGNSIIVLYFIISLVIFSNTNNSIKIRYIFIILFLLAIAIAIFNIHLIQLFSKILFFNEKATSIAIAYENSDLINKYPLLLRPFITLMSFVFLTSESLKSILAYIIFFPTATYTLLQYKKYYTTLQKSTNQIKCERKKYLNMLLAYFTILTLILILPTYANGKYYIFLIPFFLMPAYKVYKKENTLLFLVFINAIIFTNIAFYYK